MQSTCFKCKKLVFYILVHKNSCFTRRTATYCSSLQTLKLHTLDLFEFKVSVQPVAQLFRRLGIFWNVCFFLLAPSRQKQFTSTASITSSSLSVSPAPAQISQNFYRAAKSFKLRISRKNKNCSIPVSIVYAVVEKKVLQSRWESDVFDYGQDNVRSKEACRCLVSSRSQTKFFRDIGRFDSSFSSR